MPLFKLDLPRSAPCIATIDWIVVSKFEPLLLARHTIELTQVVQPENMMVRIPVQWQDNNHVYKNERLSHHVSYLLVQRLGDKPKPVPNYWPSNNPRAQT